MVRALPPSATSPTPTVPAQADQSRLIALLVVALVVAPIQPATAYSKKLQAQIALVESSLSGNVRFEGLRGDNLTERMAFHKVKGLSLAVVKDYKVIWAKGYGWADEDAGRPVTERTIFAAASVSKSINAMAVMKLAQDGKLDLSADINEILVSWKFPYDDVSRGKTISVLQLLTHTAGVADCAPAYTKRDALPTIVRALSGAEPSKFTYSDTTPAHSVIEPGLRHEYSNCGVGITQVIVEDLSGKPYEQFVRETVFRPLGMTDSCYSEECLKRNESRVAVGYNAGYEVPGGHILTPLQAAGGLWTTPTDLARFIVEVQQSYRGRSNRVLSRETTRTMLTPTLQAAPGFFLKQTKARGAKYFTHSGITKGFRSEYFGSFEGGNGVAVMVNSDTSTGNVIPEVINSVATVYGWKDFYEPEVRKKPIAVSGELLQKCEGVYTYDDQYVVILSQPDGSHYWSQNRDARMHFESPNRFFSVEYPTKKELIRDAAGNVTGFRRFLDGAELPQASKIVDVASASLSSGQLTEISWYLLESKRFDLATSYFRRLSELQPNDLMTKCNLAHCHLFAGRFEKAIEIYREILNRRVDDTRTFRETIVEDFGFFKRNGFEAGPMERMLGNLEIGESKMVSE